jgi:hypothetical protein
MPRVRQAPGGMRPGTPGQQYPNRTDLSSQPSLPARVATDQTYGKAQQQLQAQRTVPMAPPPSLIPPPGAGPAGPPPAPTAPGPAIGGPPPPPGPGALGPVDAFTNRPGEPVTHGAPMGVGPGPEALPTMAVAAPGLGLSALLTQVAQATGSSAVQQLANHAVANGQ